jgi:hypothetical protein
MPSATPAPAEGLPRDEELDEEIAAAEAATVGAASTDAVPRLDGESDAASTAADDEVETPADTGVDAEAPAPTRKRATRRRKPATARPAAAAAPRAPRTRKARR